MLSVVCIFPVNNVLLTNQACQILFRFQAVVPDLVHHSSWQDNLYYSVNYTAGIARKMNMWERGICAFNSDTPKSKDYIDKLNLQK